MRALGLILVCVLMQVMPVSAQAVITAVQMESSATAELQSVSVPSVLGKSEEEAIEELEALVLPDGSGVEIIKNYRYSSEYAADIVFEQSPVGEVTAEEAGTVYITISMGAEPDENLVTASEDANVLSSFGIASYLTEEASTSSNLGIDWNSVPSSYEFVWDNSDSCWYWGVDIDGERYKTPVGTYDTNVRHLMQLYCDGTNVYLRIVFATIYEQDELGINYLFFLDGLMTQFRLGHLNSGAILEGTDDLEVGTNQISVVHVNSGLSGEVVNGSLAYLTIGEDVNTEVELMIPLSEMANQNPDIDLENLGTIEFRSYPLMYRNITASGASTFPLATAGAAFIIIPGSTVLLKKYGRKKKNVKDSNA